MSYSPSSNIYEANLRLVEKKAPALLDMLKAEDSKPSGYQVFETREGLPSLRWKDITLHSSYAPLKEARRIMQRHAEISRARGCDAAVFLGLGLGYYLKAAYELPGPPLFIVLEPDIALIKIFLSTVDAQFLFRHTATELIVENNPQAVIDYLKTRGLRNPALISIPALQKGREDSYRPLEQALDQYLDQQEINTNTLKRFGALWTRNIIRNRRIVRSGRSIEEIAGQFSFAPALVCAAGPTLDALLPRMHLLAERMLTIAVDTAVPLLLNHNIHPDIVVVIDPQYWNTRHLERLALTRSLLVADASSHPRVFRMLSLPVFLGASIFPLGKLFDPASRPTLGAGGSVVTSAWDLARLLGTSAIYLAGVDLAFPYKRSHAKGSFFEKLWLKQSTRENTIEGNIASYLRSGGSLTTQDYNGDELQSDRRMRIYRQWLEQKAQEKNSPPCYALSRHSSRLAGVPHVPERSCASLPVVRERIDACKAQILESQALEDTAPPTSFEEFRTQLDAMQRTLTRALGHVAKLKKKSEARAPHLEALSRLDTEISQSLFKDVVGFLIPDAVQQIFQNQETGDALRNSEILYRALQYSLNYHLELLDKYT